MRMLIGYRYKKENQKNSEENKGMTSSGKDPMEMR
jgi:hypothetical protein